MTFIRASLDDRRYSQNGSLLTVAFSLRRLSTRLVANFHFKTA